MLLFVVCTRGSDLVLGREVVGQCMYRGTVDVVEDKVVDGLLVVAGHFVLFLLRLRQTIDDVL